MRESRATRSPGAIPDATRPRATATISATNAAQVTSTQVSSDLPAQRHGVGVLVREGEHGVGQGVVVADAHTRGDAELAHGPTSSADAGHLRATYRLSACRAAVASRSMADATTSSITIGADPEHVMAVIADFAAYPEWADQVKSVEILDTDAAGRPERVRFQMDAGPIKDSYTLDYTWAPDGRSVSWTLVKGQIQKAQNGSYALVGGAGGTTVTYSLAVDLNIPMIGMLRRKAEKVIIDTALKGLKRRVEGSA